MFWKEDNACFKEINWFFPFFIMAFIFFLVSLITDWLKRSTNFLHSILFFFSFLEVATWITLIILYVNKEVEGDRSKTLVAFIFQLLFNLVFIPVHIKLMLPKASDEYR